MPLNKALQNLINKKNEQTVKPQWEMPITDVRESFENLWQPWLTGEKIDLPKIDDILIDSDDTKINCRVYYPHLQQQLPVIIFAHGGGYVKGSINCYDTFCRRLAATTDAIIISVDYRLAPEYPRIITSSAEKYNLLDSKRCLDSGRRSR